MEWHAALAELLRHHPAQWVADRLRVSWRSVHRWRHHQTQPRPSTQAAICALSGAVTCPRCHGAGVVLELPAETGRAPYPPGPGNTPSAYPRKP